mmetsp:Transcript_38977/g.61701  ORF Transcript_38977/g.61701 Transcript_38977/m.61701 type:complete len:106 (-) Transcript_38977:8-325(-)
MGSNFQSPDGDGVGDGAVDDVVPVVEVSVVVGVGDGDGDAAVVLVVAGAVVVGAGGGDGGLPPPPQPCKLNDKATQSTTAESAYIAADTINNLTIAFGKGNLYWA